jgi:hypothetical protein
MSDWVTNDKDVAKLLRAADRKYARAREKARNVYPLLEKCTMLQRARDVRDQDYQAALVGAQVVR